MFFDSLNPSFDLNALVMPNFPFSNQADQGVGPGPVLIESIIIAGNTSQGSQIRGNTNDPNS